MLYIDISLLGTHTLHTSYIRNFCMFVAEQTFYKTILFEQLHCLFISWQNYYVCPISLFGYGILQESDKLESLQLYLTLA